MAVFLTMIVVFSYVFCLIYVYIGTHRANGTRAPEGGQQEVPQPD